MKKFLSLAVLFSASAVAFGQITKAQIALDENKISEAQEAIQKVLTPEAVQENLTKGKTSKVAEAYNLAGNIESRILNPQILNAAKGQPLDTLLFIKSLDKSVEYFSLSNKYDRTPDKKGVVKPKYYANNHKMLKQMMTYYAYAGQFLYARKDYAGAYNCFEKFINMPKNPIFSKKERDSIYQRGEKEYSEVAFYSAVLGFQQMKDPDKVLAHVDRTLSNPNHAEDGFIMKSWALLQKKDTAAWVACSKDAVNRLPNSTSFTQNLLSYYMMKDEKADALKTAEEFVQSAPESKMAWYANGCLKLNVLKDYSGAQAAFQKALSIDSEFAEANYNMGISYINEILSRRNELNLENTRKANYLKDVETFRSYYRKALPYLEKTRELLPDDVKLWGHNLKNVYYNLQMKDKEKEIDELLK